MTKFIKKKKRCILPDEQAARRERITVALVVIVIILFYAIAIEFGLRSDDEYARKQEIEMESER